VDINSFQYKVGIYRIKHKKKTRDQHRGLKSFVIWDVTPCGALKVSVWEEHVAFVLMAEE
jgi:hypothetical protein